MHLDLHSVLFLPGDPGSRPLMFTKFQASFPGSNIGGDKRTHGKSSKERATKRKRDEREVGRAVRDRTETGRTVSRVKNAQRNETGRWERTGGK